MKTILLAAIVSMLICQDAAAHAFLDHAEPAVGSQIAQAPAEVKIWFTEAVEPAFSAIEVQDADGKEIDNKDSHLDSKDNTLLIVSLPSMGSGTYKVFWHVVASDTHHTQGDFKFSVK